MSLVTDRPTFAGIDSRNGVGRDRVREICLRYQFIHEFEIEADCLGR
jgi:hypothetical protein